MLFLNSTTARWTEVWAALAAKFGDIACENPDSGERWQYMGSVHLGTTHVEHQFRHRDLPSVGGRTYWNHVTVLDTADYIRNVGML